MRNEECVAAQELPLLVIDRADFQKQYDERLPSYQRLAESLEKALKVLLELQDIPFLDVTFRVKAANSGYEKIIKKGYTNPFLEIQDWCGVRVVCYYPSDVERICEIIRKEFDVKYHEDTAARLSPDAFGYRSIHFILCLRAEWTRIPIYQGLETMEAEVQVRTVLMHAWAEIEHKLKYKSNIAIPQQFQRQLYRLSAKFEESDEQFDALRTGIEAYREELANKKTSIEDFRELELNLDTLVAFLDLALPTDSYRPIDTYNSGDYILNQLVNDQLTMTDIVGAFKLGKDLGVEAARKYASYTGMNTPDINQLDVFICTMAIANDKYYEENIVKPYDMDNPGSHTRFKRNAIIGMRSRLNQGRIDGSIK